MHNTPDFSIILPTYNRAHLLKRAIDSVKIQSHTNWELIIIDDGSSDNTVELMEQYNNDTRIKYVTITHSGVSAARNHGVTLVTASQLAFLDSDDEWLPEKLRKQHQYFKETDYQIHQSREIWIRNGTRVNPPAHAKKYAGDLFSVSLERCMITPSSVVMTREVWNEFGGFDTHYPACEDYELWLRISAKYPIGLLDEDLLIRYGGHADQLSSAYPAMDYFRLQALEKLLDSNKLSLDQRSQTLQVLQEKLRIYSLGCVKRSKTEELAWCDRLIQKYFPDKQ